MSIASLLWIGNYGEKIGNAEMGEAAENFSSFHQKILTSLKNF
jgi:hypothetical protein